MALFSLFISCDGVGSYSTQYQAESPYGAIREFLHTNTLNQFLSQHPDWPKDFNLQDIYIFMPLGGLTNLYFCGLGQQGKYVQIHIVQTIQRSSHNEKYCGPNLDPLVTLR
jgi:hypothetical protein